ncbi:MAG TPA: response regulator transcription factor [Acidimicrobiales bacterium]|jgi:DNA-binding NarL/FixJ family response regulator|nr:response regulator transcription factor [Acidimicrobiales bacterium]
MPSPLVRVAVANDYEIIVSGLAAMLDRHGDVEVMDKFVVGEEMCEQPIDVVLYDTFGREGVDGDQLGLLIGASWIRRVAVFTLSWADALVDDALGRGVCGVLSKSLSADALARHLHDIAGGLVVVAPPHGRVSSGAGRDWPGRSFGLSERESETLVLVAQGLRNLEIARVLYVSEDTVKTHLKRAYRKLGVANRAQATNVALRHPSFRLDGSVTPDPFPVT